MFMTVLSKRRRPHLSRSALCAAIALFACGTDDPTPVETGEPDGVCPTAEHIGGFETALRDGFTSVQGTVANGVMPITIPDEVAAEGPCRLLAPPSLFCDPSCESGTTCDATGACIELPVNVSVGVVSVTGLKAPVEMTSSPPVYYYTNLDPLEHPGFDEGDVLQLVTSGDDEIERFSLDTRGVAPLSLAATSVVLDTDAPMTLEWAAPGDEGLATIHIDLNIAQHGGTPGWIECEVPDSGEFTVPVALTDQLLASGFSGYPSIAVTRRSADSVDTALGCVEWTVESQVVLPVEIPGLTSCSNNDDCPPGESCRADLTCG